MARFKSQFCGTHPVNLSRKKLGLPNPFQEETDLSKRFNIKVNANHIKITPTQKPTDQNPNFSKDGKKIKLSRALGLIAGTDHKKFTIVGQGDHFTIWPSEAWQEESKRINKELAPLMEELGIF